MARARDNVFIDELNELGPEAVLQKKIKGEYNNRQLPLVDDFLEAHNALESTTLAREANALALKANDLAREANESALDANAIASRSKRIAIAAIIISAILSAIAVIVSIIK